MWVFRTDVPRKSDHFLKTPSRRVRQRVHEVDIGRARKGEGIRYVSHAPGVWELADRVVEVKDGRVKVAEFRDDPPQQ